MQRKHTHTHTHTIDSKTFRILKKKYYYFNESYWTIFLRLRKEVSERFAHWSAVTSVARRTANPRAVWRRGGSRIPQRSLARHDVIAVRRPMGRREAGLGPFCEAKTSADTISIAAKDGGPETRNNDEQNDRNRAEGGERWRIDRLNSSAIGHLRKIS